MRYLFITLFMFFSCGVKSQMDTVIVSHFNSIRNVPNKYYTAFSPLLWPRFTDSSFNYIIDKGSIALPALISFITDTTLSHAVDPIEGCILKKGDLALILINYIEYIPLFKVTGIQYCICCEYGRLAVGFLEDVDQDRSGFLKRYLIYYWSRKRQDLIRPVTWN